MSIFQRSFLYVTRKRGKSLILLLILVLISTLVITGLSIKKSTARAASDLRQNLGGTIKIQADYANNPDKWQSSSSENGYASVYSGEQVNTKLIDTIMKDSRLRAYNAEGVSYLYLDDLQLLPGSYSNAWNDPEWAKVARFVTNTDSSLHKYFQDGSAKLISGHHISADNPNEVLVSEELAKLNNLSVGDTVKSTITEDIGGDFGAAGTVFESKIAGIYKITSKQSVSENTPESDIVQNFIFAAPDFEKAVLEAFGDPVDNHNQATFFLNDPKDFDAVIRDLEKNSEIDWTAYTLDLDNSSYESAAAPLEKLSSLLTALIIGTIIICILLLFFILNMWMKTRVYETGILLSIGVARKKILFQFLLEGVIICILAFTLTFAVSGKIADKAGNLMLQSAESEDSGDSTTNLSGNIYFDDGDAPEIGSSSGTVKNLDVDVSVVNVVIVFVSGLLLVLSLIWLTSYSILKIKPRDLLTAMS